MIVEKPASAELATSACPDYAAATPLDPEVLEAMTPYLTGRFYNPSAPYALARNVRADVEAARATVARCIGARPGNVTFTAGATEANNLAFAATDGHVVTDAIEHESVLACADVLSAVTPAHAAGLPPPGNWDDRLRAFRVRVFCSRMMRSRPSRRRPACRRPHPCLPASMLSQAASCPPWTWACSAATC